MITAQTKKAAKAKGTSGVRAVMVAAVGAG